jgi:LVIVD repeat-containing protein
VQATRNRLSNGLPGPRRTTTGVDAAAGLVWIADFGGWLRVFDVSNPAAPVALGAVKSDRAWIPRSPRAKVT